MTTTKTKPLPKRAREAALGELPKCSMGHQTAYSAAIGACRCEFGALVRMNGTEIRSCA